MLDGQVSDAVEARKGIVFFNLQPKKQLNIHCVNSINNKYIVPTSIMFTLALNYIDKYLKPYSVNKS